MTTIEMNSTSVEEASEKSNGAATVTNGEAGSDQHNDVLGDHELEIQNYEEDLMGCLEEEEEKDQPRRRSWDRTRGKEKRNSRDREKDSDREKDRDREKDKDRERERERDRDRDRGKRKSRSNERRREYSRRDPSKSSKDIEQDKAKAKKDNETKVLAEKEKAIKTLLDSNDVVPPGTEEEAIQIIAEKSAQTQDEEDRRKSRDSRRRSPVHARLGSRRSPRRSPLRRSPIRLSPLRRRSPSSDRRRRSSYDRRRSYDRENSAERREASRRRLRERRERELRSRSRDRHRSRSRSIDRRRSRSMDRRRRSRSFDRHSPRRRRRSMSRSPLRSPNRSRKRSPFINEIARQFSADQQNALAMQQQALGSMHGMGPGGGPPFLGPGAGPPGGPMPGPLDPRMIPGVPPGLLSAPGMIPGPGGIIPGAGPPGPIDVHPGAVLSHPGGPLIGHPQGPIPGGPPFVGFDGCPPGNIGFDPMNRGPDYAEAPMMYTQPSGMAPIPHPMSPQPVPAPGTQPMMYPSLGQTSSAPVSVPGPKYSPNTRSMSPIDDRLKKYRHEERMRTPEPPIISDFKSNEKASLSSLLEASVSTKDTSSSSLPFKGFRAEVIRQCEKALRSLPTEDPRLNMKGRFFFDPAKKLHTKDTKETTSNSVLLRKGRTEIHWDEEFNQMTSTAMVSTVPMVRKPIVTHQKICQTDESTRESIAIQTEIFTTDFGQQVGPLDLLSAKEVRGGHGSTPSYEERRNYEENRYTFDDRGNRVSLGDRLDWNMRETFDHGSSNIGKSSHSRESDDLRWSLSKNTNRVGNSWNRGFSPNHQSMNDHMLGSGGPGGMDMRGSMDMMRDRPDMDMRERLMDRGMDYRDRELEMRDRGDVRGMDMVRERDLSMEMRDGGGRGVPPSLLEIGGRGALGSGGGGLNDFVRRETIDDYELRKGFGGGSGFGRVGGGIGGGMMDSMDRDRNEPMPRGRSPPPIMDEPDDLEIIEERVYDRDGWQRLGNSTGGATFNNARGGTAIRTGNNSLTAKRPLRGRIGGFGRPNF